jgi:TPR repeat protein
MKGKQLAANYGNGLTRWSLGLAYKDGKMTPKDNVQAYLWFSLAIADSEPESRQLFQGSRDSLAKEMTVSEIAEAHKLAREWKPKSP